MKKTLMIALAGLMLFAFTQCGSNDSNKNDSNKEGDKKEKVKNGAQDAVKNDNSADFNERASDIEELSLGGTEQFNDNVKMLKGVMEAINNSNTCEEFQTNLISAAFMAMAYIKDEYPDGQKMTEDEQKQLEKISKELDQAMEKKQKELGCEEGFGDDDDDFEDFDLSDDDLDLDFDLDDEEDDDDFDF